MRKAGFLMAARNEHRSASKRVTSTRRWQSVRHSVLERDGWKCRTCSKRGRLEVHHVKRVADHPELSFDPANLTTLCSSCHSIQTNIELGRKPDPRRALWRNAVADLATKTPEQQEKTQCSTL